MVPLETSVPMDTTERQEKMETPETRAGHPQERAELLVPEGPLEPGESEESMGALVEKDAPSTVTGNASSNVSSWVHLALSETPVMVGTLEPPDLLALRVEQMLAHCALLVPAETQDTQEAQELLEPMAHRAHQEHVETQAVPGVPEQKESVEVLVRVVTMERLERWVPQETQEPQAGELEPQLEPQAMLELRAPQAVRDPPEDQETPEPQGQWVAQDTVEGMATREQPAPQVREGSMGHPVALEALVTLEITMEVEMERLETQDTLAQRVQGEHADMSVPREKEEVPLEESVKLVLSVILEAMGAMEREARTASLDIQERLAPRESWEIQGTPMVELQDRLEIQAPMEDPVHRERTATQGAQEQRDHRDPTAWMAVLADPAVLARRAHPDTLVEMEFLEDHTVQARREMPEPMVALGRQATMELQAGMESLGHLGQLEQMEAQERLAQQEVLGTAMQGAKETLAVQARPEEMEPLEPMGGACKDRLEPRDLQANPASQLGQLAQLETLGTREHLDAMGRLVWLALLEPTGSLA